MIISHFIDLLLQDNEFREYFFEWIPEYFHRNSPIEYAIDNNYIGILKHRELNSANFIYTLQNSKTNIETIKWLAVNRREIIVPDCQMIAYKYERYDVLTWLYANKLGDCRQIEDEFREGLLVPNYGVINRLYDCGIRPNDVYNYTRNVQIMQWLDQRFDNAHYELDLSCSIADENLDLMVWICDHHPEQINYLNISNIINYCNCGDFCREKGRKAAEKIAWIFENYPDYRLVILKCLELIKVE